MPVGSSTVYMFLNGVEEALSGMSTWCRKYESRIIRVRWQSSGHLPGIANWEEFEFHQSAAHQFQLLAVWHWPNSSSEANVDRPTVRL